MIMVAPPVLHAPISPFAQLRAADARFAQLYPYPRRMPADNLGEILQAYRGIVDEYGPLLRAQAGIGNCLFLFGRYGEAKDAFRRAGPRYRSRFEEASHYAEITEEINRQSKMLPVRQLRHITHSDRWVALLGTSEDGWHREDAPSKLVMFKQSARAKRLDRVGPSLDFDSIWTGDFATLYLAHMSRENSSWRLMLFGQGRADRVPVEINFYSVSPFGLKAEQSLYADEGGWVRGPSASHGLLVGVGPAWKVGWQDVYEWTGHRFEFANRRFPSCFPIVRPETSSSGDDKPSYSDWMILAAELDIHGRFAQGLAAWRRARRLCRQTVAKERAGDTDFRASFYGSASENLKEIATRIYWLRRHDFNHALLYRPIDFALQFPPFKLGNPDDLKGQPVHDLQSDRASHGRPNRENSPCGPPFGIDATPVTARVRSGSVSVPEYPSIDRHDRRPWHGLYRGNHESPSFCTFREPRFETRIRLYAVQWIARSRNNASIPMWIEF